MLQKVIQVGNSLAVVLPKTFTQKADYHAGDLVHIETNENLKSAYIRPSKDQKPALTPEFKQWLDEITKKEEEIIKALAKA